ncbi:unnamed protein product [Rotaria sp. Silwood1]|nr:unnamed protein product [Rotaria sp. Silwood1]
MEYEGTLKLGRISIGNRLHPVTVYQPTNKMTFCTNCWLIGHTRATCSVRERKCRICLKVYDHDHTSTCSGTPLCAQCGQDHHSLDPKCEYIQQYRKKLNLEVKQAVNDGIINRKPIQVHQQQQSQIVGAAYDIEYPTLPNINIIKSKENKVWQDVTSQHDQGVLNTKNIQLHQVSLRTIDASLMKLIKNVLSPLIDIIPDVHDQIRKQISTALIDLECPSRIHAEQVRMNFNSDYNSSITKSTTLSTNVPDNNKVDASPTSSSNTPTLIEEEEKSAMVHPCS